MKKNLQVLVALSLFMGYTVSLDCEKFSNSCDLCSEKFPECSFIVEKDTYDGFCLKTSEIKVLSVVKMKATTKTECIYADKTIQRKKQQRRLQIQDFPLQSVTSNPTRSNTPPKILDQFPKPTLSTERPPHFRIPLNSKETSQRLSNTVPTHKPIPNPVKATFNIPSDPTTSYERSHLALSIGPPPISTESQQSTVGPPPFSTESQQSTVGPPPFSTEPQQSTVGPPPFSTEPRQSTVGPPPFSTESQQSTVGPPPFFNESQLLLPPHTSPQPFEPQQSSLITDLPPPIQHQEATTLIPTEPPQIQTEPTAASPTSNETAQTTSATEPTLHSAAKNERCPDIVYLPLLPRIHEGKEVATENTISWQSNTKQLFESVNMSFSCDNTQESDIDAYLRLQCNQVSLGRKLKASLDKKTAAILELNPSRSFKIFCKTLAYKRKNCYNSSTPTIFKADWADEISIQSRLFFRVPNAMRCSKMVKKEPTHIKLARLFCESAFYANRIRDEIVNINDITYMLLLPSWQNAYKCQVTFYRKRYCYSN